MHLRLMRARNGLGSASQKREVLSRKGKVSNGPPARNQLCKEITQGTWPWSPFNSAALALIWSRENRVEVVFWMSLLALECIEDCDLFIIIHLYYIMYIAHSCNSAAETKPGVQPILVKQFINKQCMLRPKPVGLFGGLISPDQPPKGVSFNQGQARLFFALNCPTWCGTTIRRSNEECQFSYRFEQCEAKVWVHGT